MRLIPFLACIALLTLIATPHTSHAAEKGKPQVETQNFGDWRMDCPKGKTSKKDCQLLQQLVTELKNGKKRPVLAVMGAMVNSKDKDGKERVRLHIRLITPLNTLLIAGLGVKLDEGKVIKVPYITCTHVGCMAELRVGDDLLGQLKKGNALVIAYKNIDSKQQTTLKVSLKGFTAGYAALVAG